MASGTGGELLVLVASGTGGELLITGGELLVLVASCSYWWRANRTGGELLVLVATYSYWWRVVLLVASGPTGGEWSY